jgi:N-acetylglucosaminyldiphosphoundecaprenol N-acetyl-beta-D-mannosaminyltransferase
LTRARFPRLKIAYQHSPPFGSVSAEQDEECVAAINRDDVGILFIGLGCPKQELWMAAHKDRIHAVMLGVGAAFDFLAGAKPQAPQWMQSAGLEWLFRLMTEPRRLWARYLVHNPRFMFLSCLQLAKLERSPQS